MSARKTILIAVTITGLLCAQDGIATIAATEVATALEGLSVPDADNRCRAARSLGDMGEGALSAYDVLFKLALSEDLPKVRAAASAALGKIAKDRAVEQLIAELRTNTIASVREHVADAFMEPQLQDLKAAVPLFEALRDENQQVRHRAGIALQYYKDDRLAELLIATLQKKDDPAREWAPWLLGRMKRQDAIDPLISHLDDDVPAFRKSVIAALRDIKSRESVAPLIAVATQDKVDDVRAKAIQCLGELGDASAGKPLLGFLSDPNPEIRASTAGALGMLRIAEAKEPLREMFKRGSPREKLAAMAGLCLLGDQQAVPLIVASLDEEPPECIPYFMEGLVELNAVAQITSLRNHKNEAVRSAAQRAIQKLEKKKLRSSNKGVELIGDPLRGSPNAHP